MPPDTRYAKSRGVHIAYQVVGKGDLDLVLVPGWVSHVEYAWEDPSFSRFLHQLASFSRLILLDRSGTGLSDPVAEPPSLEERMDEVRAVMDAAASQQAALFGISEGGPMCLTFAATHPERTRALVLCGTTARVKAAPDYEIGRSEEALDGFLDLIGSSWGTGMSADVFAPSLAGDDSFRRSWARFERFATSPAGAQKLIRMLHEIDARHVLSSIRVPTLVLQREGDRAMPPSGARYIAERIPGAKYVELPGVDHFAWVGDVDALLGEVEEFLTGVRTQRETDRVLATVMFTDIVGSTARAAELGDRRWSELLASHQVVVRRELSRFGGREVKTMGDGFLATFDGPARAIRCACAARSGVRLLGIELRAGLHTGECERIGDDVRGIAVHIAARVAALAAPGEILVSSTVKDLVAGSELRFAERGARELSGVPGQWQLFAVDE